MDLDNKGGGGGCLDLDNRGEGILGVIKKMNNNNNNRESNIDACE
jgi:hypothetical protein